MIYVSKVQSKGENTIGQSRLKKFLTPPNSGPNDLEIIKYDPPPAISPFVTIAEKERTVRMAIIKQRNTMSSVPMTPACAIPQPKRKNKIIPIIFNEQGTKTPFNVAS